MIEIKTKFVTRTTVRVLAYSYDDADALVDPTTSIKVTIYDPDDTKLIDGVAMTKESKGVYSYFYKTTVTSKTGRWRGEVVVIDGVTPNDYTSIGNFVFRLIK